MKDYTTQTSGKNTGSKKLSKIECEAFADKNHMKFRVLWDIDRPNGGCWPYCIDTSTKPKGCHYNKYKDEVHYTDVSVPGWDGNDCSKTYRCIIHSTEQLEDGHDFHHKWRFRQKSYRKFTEIAHANNDVLLTGHWGEYQSNIAYDYRYGKANRPITQGKQCKEAVIHLLTLNL